MRPNKIMEIMDTIESRRLDARLNVASSFSIFFKAAYREQAPRALIEKMHNSPRNIWLVLQRTVELTQKEIDLRYENPWDTALTVYMWALSLVDLEIAETAAAFVAEADNCWWAKKLANHILSKKFSKDSVFHSLKFEEIRDKQEVYRQKGVANIEYSVKTYSFADRSERKTVKHGTFEGSDKVYGAGNLSRFVLSL